MTDRLKAIWRVDTIRILIALLILLACFSLFSPMRFLSVSNFSSILLDAAVLLVLAVGATFVIITGGIDLSVGGVLVFSSVTAAQTMAALGSGSPGVLVCGFAVAILSGAAWGMLNGFLVAVARVPPLVVTLATMGASLGAALLITDGVDVRNVPFSLVTSIGSGQIAGIPVIALIAALIALLGGLLLSTTRFGRYTYAIGSNMEALRRTGVAVKAHLMRVYLLAGALAGIAGYLSVARFATTTLSGHSTDNLQAITAVVIGGTSLFGGRGVMFGTVIGVFIPTVLQNGFIVLGVTPYWQRIAVAAVLIGSVYIDQRHRKAQDRA